MKKNKSTDTRIQGTGADKWRVQESHVDMTAEFTAPLPATMQTEKQSLTFDVRRSALIVIDMQNDFCAEGGWTDQSGYDFIPDRKPIEPLKNLLPVTREASIPVIWLNWGNRPDLLNMAPNQMHIFNPSGQGIGLGDPLSGKDAHVLQKDSWSTAVVDELEQKPEDIRVDKHRISGFWDTPLDSILKNLGVRTIFFAGVNTDQCVMCTLQDASFLGYGCVLISDCCGTTSPDYCVDATVFNVREFFGFVSDSKKLIQSLQN
jgi:nicotinamidase-related amidase